MAARTALVRRRDRFQEDRRELLALIDADVGPVGVAEPIAVGGLADSVHTETPSEVEHQRPARGTNLGNRVPDPALNLLGVDECQASRAYRRTQTRAPP